MVPHTHWDREWYEPQHRFRQRLVTLLDRVIELLDTGRLPSFLLDGQTVLVRDYLAVRPERADDIQRLAEERKLLLGPWYVLADELMTSDEALVRNLMIGKQEAGSGWLELGYSPDAFGHPAALPTILGGFGIEHAILWRGYGGRPGQSQDLFHWQGPDRSRVLVHHLPPAGYELGANLPLDPAAAKERWTTTLTALEPRAAGRPLLLMSGADHHVPHATFLEALDAAPAHCSPRAAHPLEYFTALPSDLRVPEVEGELRFSYGYCLTLQGTFAVRASLKRAIREAERLLVRWAEPQVALSKLGGESGRALLNAAWRMHLENCFHDTQCGTTTDEVARDAERRVASVIAQARGLMDDALHTRLGQDRARARRSERNWQPALAVLNPSAYDRSGVLETTLLATVSRVLMGRSERQASSPVTGYAPPVVMDTEGREVALQVLDSYDAYDRLDAPDAYPLQDHVRAWRVALWVEEVPALGVKTLRARAARGGAGQAAPDKVRVHGKSLRGLRWTARPGRTGFRLTSVEGQDVDRVADVTSELDDGDLYTFDRVAGDAPLAARWGPAWVTWRGPLIGAITRPFAIHGRARGVVHARLDAGSSLVRFAIEGENLTGGHRLRIRFPRPASSQAPSSSPLTAHRADQHYGAVSRRRSDCDPNDFPAEWPIDTAPMHRYVTIPGAVTVLSRDCIEYEITEGAIVVTLLRCVSQLSKGNLAARRGHVAWPVATPDARELGRFRAEFAVAPGSMDAEGAAEEFHAPLGGRVLRYAIEPPDVVRGPRLEGAGLVFKSCKTGATPGETVLRCVNLSGARVRGMWVMPSGVRRAWKARLDETKLEEVTVAGGRRQIVFDAAAREVVTLVAEWAGAS